MIVYKSINTSYWGETKGWKEMTGELEHVTSSGMEKSYLWSSNLQETADQEWAK